MAVLLTRLARLALRRGWRNGSRGWFALGAAAMAARVVAGAVRTKPERTSFALRPGETVQVRARRP